jgi:lycopene cyclase domain-containing protein
MLNSYTALTICSLLFVYILDHLLKTHLFKKKLFWIFHLIIIPIEALVNGYLTWRPIVLYNPDYFLGVRIGTIPIEDFFYGFALLSLNLIIFEYLKARNA